VPPIARLWNYLCRLNLMQLTAPSRRIFYPALVALFLFCTAPCFARRQPQAKPNQAARQAAPQVKPPNPQKQYGAPKAAVGPKPNQEHLEEWMDRHRNLPLAQQQAALQNEPGFRELPQQTQQRMLNNLAKLNNMPEEQRRRLLEHNEVMEHLTPPQRQQVRGAMQEFNALPPDRRRLVARAFRDLREMPEPQRQAILGSDRLHGEFSDYERSTLSNLLAVEPYLPVQRPPDTANGK
jgi:hypothetical protein